MKKNNSLLKKINTKTFREKIKIIKTKQSKLKKIIKPIMNNQFTSSENFLSFKSEEERKSVSFLFPRKAKEEERRISAQFGQTIVYNRDFIFFIYRNVFLALVILITTSGIYSIISNLQNNDSNYNFLYQASIANGFQSQSFLKNQPYFHLFAEIALILFFLIVRKQLIEKSQKFFFRQHSKHSEFALLISGISKDSTLEELGEINFFLQNIKISDLLINLNTNTVIFLFDENRKFSGKGIICFNSHFGKEAILNFQKISIFERIQLLFQRNLKLKENDHRIHIKNILLVFEEICEPQDIYWLNCNVSQKMRVVANLLLTLSLCAFFIVLEAIIIYYEIELLSENGYMIIVSSIGLGFFMLVVNMVVYPRIVRILSKYSNAIILSLSNFILIF